ncbi:MAG: VOC family protein [Chloroflexota bacterium]
MTTNLDHLVIGAHTLEEGVAYVESLFGVTMPYGGEHPHMGTHNCLMQLGNGVFLEIIALNPQMMPPSRPRWFGLDDPFVRGQLKEKPRLISWVVNTPDVKVVAGDASFSFGEITPLSRGSLNWLFALPEDGRLLAGGAVPYTIEWKTTPHPAGQMADLGCRLSRLEIFHPHASWLNSILMEIGASQLVDIHEIGQNETFQLKAIIDTPLGEKVLD